MHLACHRLIKAPNPASSPGELVFTPLGTARSADSALRRPRAAREPGLWQACALVGRGWVCCCHSRLQVCRAGGNGSSLSSLPAHRASAAGVRLLVQVTAPPSRCCRQGGALGSSQSRSRKNTPVHRFLAGASWASCPQRGRQTTTTGGGHCGTCATQYVLCQLRQASLCRRRLGPGCPGSEGQAASTELGRAGQWAPSTNEQAHAAASSGREFRRLETAWRRRSWCPVEADAEEGGDGTGP